MNDTIFLVVLAIVTYANFDTLTLLIQHLTGNWVTDINFAYMIAIAYGSALVLIFLIYHITRIEKVLTNPIYDLISALDVYKKNKEEFNRYISLWYEKIFENLDYSATFEAEVLRLTNIERTQRGLAPLKMREDLQVTARIKAGEMVKYEYYGHGSLSGLPDEVVKRYYNIGENIAMGQTSPEVVVRDWMNSPGHRANILDPTNVYIGVGYCNDYWVQQFGGETFLF